jgi:DNA-binding response OmpR family regulator
MPTSKKADKKQNIVLVEDDPFLIDMYMAKFTEAGYEIDVASQGNKAMDMIKEKRPAIVLTDVVMPGLDGFELLKLIKSDAATKDIPVVMLTNLGQQEDIDKAKGLGASDYLVKAHFTPSEVVAKVKAILGGLK